MVDRIRPEGSASSREIGAELMERYITLFPLGAVVFSVFAALVPGLLAPLQGWIVPLLGVVMFGMGITLTPDNFLAVFRQPRLILLGVVLQFLLMPFFAWLLGVVLNMPLLLAAGLILVGACPGGTASNVICYLARGDVALSITLTSVSTVLAVIMTPFLTWFYIGRHIPVPVLDMLLDILLIIIVPVVLGLLVNRALGEKLGPIKRGFPLLSMLAIILIIGIIIAMNEARLARLIPAVVAGVLLHNALGLLGGYGIPWLLGYDERICRTLAIEVGMQNSGLGVALAVKYLAPAAALPGAIFSIWHNISGAILASLWVRSERDNLPR